MVLINDLTIGDINSALIHLQRARGEVVGGEKGDTIQNISITNKGTSSRDWSNEIERLAKKVSDNEEEIERVRVELMELFNSLADNHIINVEYIQEDRTLVIETNTDEYKVEIPEDNVKLYINDNVLYFQTPSQTKSVELPYIPLSEKGVANGVATLDSSGRLPYSQLPESAMEFLGEWDASTNTPTLKDGTGTNGNFYIVSVGGTVNFGTQASPRVITFYPNDRVVYEGDNERWFRLPAGSVVTVNGLSGVVELNGTNVNYDNTSGSPTLKAKIDDVETKAETQSDWNETNSSAVSYIKNKPTIPPAQVQSDWTQTDSTQKDFIKNKIPIWITAGQSGSDMTPVDNITNGQMRPPTSNAVFDILNPLAVSKGGTGQTDLANVAVGSADKWTTARDVKIQDADGTNTGSAVSVDGSANKTLKLPSTIKASITGNCSGSSGSAGKLTSARTTYVTLGTASTTTTRDWSGTTTIPVSGTLAVGNGGTGQTSLSNVSVGNSSKLGNVSVQTSSIGGGTTETGNHWSYVTKAKFTSTSGYIVYSNGLKIQWGIHSNTGGNTTQTVNYPLNATSGGFTQAPSVNVTYRKTDSGGVYWYALNVHTITTTSFKISSYSSFDNNLKFCWMAIGY